MMKERSTKTLSILRCGSPAKVWLETLAASLHGGFGTPKQVYLGYDSQRLAPRMPCFEI
jgi:hypothetical protein